LWLLRPALAGSKLPHLVKVDEAQLGDPRPQQHRRGMAADALQAGGCNSGAEASLAFLQQCVTLLVQDMCCATMLRWRLGRPT